MFCIKCGSQNSDEAIYCQKCGATLETEEETRVAVSSSSNSPENEEEEQIFSINPTLMFVKIGYGAAVVSAFLLVILLNLFGNWAGLAIPYWLTIPGGLLVLAYSGGLSRQV